jgi:threonyl-tRNA synthetase
MSLEFVIIPVTKDYENLAYELSNKMKKSANTSLNIEFDTNYNLSLNTRTNKHKRDDKNIIIINDTYSEQERVVVSFSDKGSRSKTMNIEEFLELIASFDYDEKEDENNDSIIKNANDENDGLCVIM